MKSLLAWVLTVQIFLLSLGGIKATVYYALNKSYIIQELCNFKDEPTNTCQGQCHLKDTLKKNAEEDGAHQPLAEGQLAVFVLPSFEEDILDVGSFCSKADFLPWSRNYESVTGASSHRPPPSRG